MVGAGSQDNRLRTVSNTHIKEYTVMSASPVKTVSISTDPDQPSLSKEQKTFNARIKQIEKRRDRLAAWEAVIPVFQQRFSEEMQPLIEAENDLKTELLRRLDSAVGQKGITKSECNLLSDLILGLAAQILEERDDAEVKDIYNRHCEGDYDAEQAAVMSEMKQVLEQMLGVQLGDDGEVSSPEDVLKRAHAHYEAEAQARAQRQASRKKTPKQLAREARLAEEAAQVSQCIREVYRKLASALHPDREPDPEERARKTMLMQRANEAYGKNNLLQLLELQLELEHIDQTAIDTLSEDRLKRYNIILKEQLGELDEELMHVEQSFRAQFCLSPERSLSPNTVMAVLQRDIARATHLIRLLEYDVDAASGLKTLKAWLKAVRH